MQCNAIPMKIRLMNKGYFETVNYFLFFFIYSEISSETQYFRVHPSDFLAQTLQFQLLFTSLKMFAMSAICLCISRLTWKQKISHTRSLWNFNWVFFPALVGLQNEWKTHFSKHYKQFIPLLLVRIQHKSDTMADKPNEDVSLNNYSLIVLFGSN